MYEVPDFNPDEWVVKEQSFVNLKRCNSKKVLGGDISLFPWSIRKTVYKHIDPEKHYWSQLKIDILHNGEEWISFNRNYHAEPPFVYVVQNNKEYIITSADYQCLTIVNLTDKKIESYCLGSYDKGWGFCPIYIDADSNKDGTIDLRVEGCYWGGCDEYYTVNGIKDLDQFEIPEGTETSFVYPEDGEHDEDDEEDGEGD